MKGTGRRVANAIRFSGLAELLSSIQDTILKCTETPQRTTNRIDSVWVLVPCRCARLPVLVRAQAVPSLSCHSLLCEIYFSHLHFSMFFLNWFLATSVPYQRQAVTLKSSKLNSSCSHCTHSHFLSLAQWPNLAFDLIDFSCTWAHSYLDHFELRE